MLDLITLILGGQLLFLIAIALLLKEIRDKLTKRNPQENTTKNQ